ncbi:MAG: hypothetical protein AABO41_05655 [Acidobacteriota bacterium]
MASNFLELFFNATRLKLISMEALSLVPTAGPLSLCRSAATSEEDHLASSPSKPNRRKVRALRCKHLAIGVKSRGKFLSAANTPLGATLRAECATSQRKRATLGYEDAAPVASDHLRGPSAAGRPLSCHGGWRIDQPADKPHNRIGKSHEKDKPEQHRN